MNLRAILLVSLVGCASQTTPAPDPDSAIETTPDSPVSPPACTCGANQGCLTVAVTASADSTIQPWDLFPDQADGRGTLRAIAHFGAAHLFVQRLGDTDVTSGATYRIDFGCVDAISLSTAVYLDDNGNAPADLQYSDEALDSCGSTNDVAVTAGERTEVEVVLLGRCD